MFAITLADRSVETVEADAVETWEGALHLTDNGPADSTVFVAMYAPGRWTKVARVDGGAV